MDEEEDAERRRGWRGGGSIKGLSFPQVLEWGARPWMVVVGALRQPPGKEGDECILGLAVLPGYQPVFPPPSPFLSPNTSPPPVTSRP